MNSPADVPPAGERPPSQWPGYVWSVILSGGLIWFEYRITPRDALDLREGALFLGIVFGLPLFLSMSITSIAWLCAGIRRVVRRERARWVPWIKLGIIAAVIGGIAMTRGVYVPPSPVLPESEPVYLQIAMVAREELAKPEIKGHLALDPKRGQEGDVQRKARTRLEQIIPAYWRRSLLGVWIDGDCVVLERGSGMLGRVGVRIYDRGAALIHPEEELRQNSYLPRQQKITERLWLFASD